MAEIFETLRRWSDKRNDGVQRRLHHRTEINRPHVE